MKQILILAIIITINNLLYSQLLIDGGQLTIEQGATIKLKGDLESNKNITGKGKLVLNGDTLQKINMYNNAIKNLEIANSKNVFLESNLKISDSLFFTNGKLVLANYNVSLADTTQTIGAGTNKFVETNATGKVIKEITANVINLIIPVGFDSIYAPAYISTNGAYTNANVYVQAKKADVYTKRHPRATDYSNVYWPIVQTGINGSLRVAGQYKNTGNETAMLGYYNNGTNWSVENTAINYSADTVGALIVGNGELYAMNKFVLANVKAFLQAPYNSTTNLMDDKLRTNAAYVPGNFPTANLIPLNDPYRTATYNANFVHVNNATAELIDSAVLKDQPDPTKNVVDWVFVELRSNVAAPTIVLQTRSALLLRDGSIMDIDGKSPLYFNNVDTGMFNIAIKHRNHLGIRTSTAKGLNYLYEPVAINLKASANVLNGFGANLSVGNIGLYAGNVNQNSTIRISGASTTLSDFEKLKSLLGSSLILNNIYSAGDANLNRTVRISGASTALSDFEFLKSILGSQLIINQPSF